VAKGRIKILEGNQLFGRVPCGDSAATKTKNYLKNMVKDKTSNRTNTNDNGWA